MTELSIDRYDLQLLSALQHDGHATNAGLGEKANLSASQISRRIQRLEEAIGGRLFDRTKSSVQLTELGRAMLPNFGSAHVP